ncbi:MAG: CHASE2 domain-containing protein [Cyclobacteriaceae bacterium]|nr:MAG: CHASE2 domain-containing protein [Cyclobacteriaceae bacterium]
MNQVLLKDFDLDIIKDKIILVGYLGPSDDDKFMTPLKYDTKSLSPYMYSTEILANVIEQILGK